MRAEPDRRADRPRATTHQAHVDGRHRADLSIEFGIVGRQRRAEVDPAVVAQGVRPPQRPDHPRQLQLYQTFEHEFFDALITETTFPALDGALEGRRVPQDQAAARARRSPRLDPGSTRSRATSARSRSCGCARLPPQHRWHRRHEVREQDRVVHDQAGRQEAVHGRRAVPADRADEDRVPEHHRHDRARRTPTSCSSGTTTTSSRGSPDPKAQKSGSLEFLSPDRRQDAVPHQPVRGRHPRPQRSMQSTANADRSSA